MTTGHVVLTIEEAPIVPNEQVISKLPKFLDTAEASGLLKQRIVDLEADLQATEESLQSMVEELQTSNEELQSTNEELHSVNEELYTVSSEHQRKIDELTILSDDMNHLLKATSIGIVFLDEHRRIRRFTPSATTAFNLLPQDVGRPFSHTTYRFDTINLDQMMTQVEESGQAIEEEIHVDGQDYFLSILPYKASVKNTSGIVMTLVPNIMIKMQLMRRVRVSLILSGRHVQMTFTKLLPIEKLGRVLRSKKLSKLDPRKVELCHFPLE